VKSIRLLLADDHALVRAGIRALINRLAGMEVVAEAGDGREALRLIEQLQPDVALLDITMPGLNGFEVLDYVTRYSPGVRVIILSIHQSREYATQALKAGAAGYLPKAAASNELKEAIDTVTRGETYVSTEVAPDGIPASADTEQSRLEKLTPRQREILTLIAQANATKDIARSLNISVKTVESHRSKLMERLGIHDVAGLVRYAIRMGLVKIE